MLKSSVQRKEYYCVNKDKVKDVSKEYYMKHKEAVKERQMKYRIDQKEAIKERKRLYYLKNKEAFKERKKKYYLLNKEALSAANRQYRQDNILAIKASKMHYRANNREANLEAQRQYRLKNKEAVQERLKLYYLNNKDHIKIQKKEYQLKNNHHIRLTHKHYRITHKEDIKLAQKQYYVKNKEAIILYKKQYRLNNKLITRPRKYKIWNRQDQVIKFFEAAREVLFVNDPNDWYRISRNQLSRVGGATLYTTFGNLGKALQFAFPEVNWDQSKFSFRGKKSTQRWLKVMLQQILPETDVIEDFQHPDLYWDETERYKMELDIWIPKHKIALEYQGEHHYHDLHFAYGPSGTLSLYSQRDLKKKEACLNAGITLITIPYWWDGKKESLSSTLSHIRPDIFQKTDFVEIPSSPPNTTTKTDTSLKKNQISTFLMHGQSWDGQDPKGWIISEKLDGFRAFWNGSFMFSKNGNILPVPPEFTQSLPRDICLDGELWSGYGQYNSLASILRNSTIYPQNSPEVLELWKDVKFCIFDAPMHPGNYEERYSFASKSVTSGANICFVPIVHCLGFDHLQKILHETTKKKGEGVMLYHPSSKYTSGRTSNLLKVKASKEEDVKFLSINPNSYSFVCVQKNGIQCIVKCSGWDYSFPPSPGTVLTVKHYGIFDSSHKLKYPQLDRVRNDLDWN